MTTNLSRGITTSIFLRLCSRAPLIIIESSGIYPSQHLYPTTAIVALALKHSKPIEIVNQPHPLCPPLLQRRGGSENFEGALPLQATLGGIDKVSGEDYTQVPTIKNVLKAVKIGVGKMKGMKQGH